MKNNKGFTLTEVLAVISIIGVISVLVFPTLLNVFNKSKHMIDDMTKEDIIDAAKMYVTDLDMGLKNYKYQGTKTITINGNNYAPGAIMSGYDLKVYIIENKGITVSIKDLVKDGYYDSECDYDSPKENKKNHCKVKETCVLKVKINGRVVENDKYYVTDSYEAELMNGCE